MRFTGRRLTGGAIAVAITCLLGVAFVAGQKTSAQAQPMAEEVYSDVQVLKGIPVDEFNDTMGMFASALLLDCVGCHSPANHLRSRGVWGTDPSDSAGAPDGGDDEHDQSHLLWRRAAGNLFHMP